MKELTIITHKILCGINLRNLSKILNLILLQKYLIAPVAQLLRIKGQSQHILCMIRGVFKTLTNIND